MDNLKQEINDFQVQNKNNFNLFCKKLETLLGLINEILRDKKHQYLITDNVDKINEFVDRVKLFDSEFSNKKLQVMGEITDKEEEDLSHLAQDEAEFYKKIKELMEKIHEESNIFNAEFKMEKWDDAKDIKEVNEDIEELKKTITDAVKNISEELKEKADDDHKGLAAKELAPVIETSKKALESLEKIKKVNETEKRLGKLVHRISQKEIILFKELETELQEASTESEKIKTLEIEKKTKDISKKLEQIKQFQERLREILTEIKEEKHEPEEEVKLAQEFKDIEDRMKDVCEAMIKLIKKIKSESEGMIADPKKLKEVAKLYNATEFDKLHSGLVAEVEAIQDKNSKIDLQKKELIKMQRYIALSWTNTKTSIEEIINALKKPETQS